MTSRDRPKLILSVSVVAETVAETEYIHTAETEYEAETPSLVSTVTTDETEYLNLIHDMQLLKVKWTRNR